jgi:tetratricopeptide (TPR) repeat protein
MKKLASIGFAVMVGMVLTAAPVNAWGPRANLAFVTAAMNLVSREGRVPLSKLDKDILSGASMPASQIAEIYPNYETDPIGAIEAEMYLLEAVRGERLDPYFAFRLGMLGKLAAEATAPMLKSPPAYRNLYYADVEENIDRVSLGPSRRVPVDPRTYFAQTIREAGSRDTVYERDYKSAVGFNGQAKTALSEDATRSISAVADVWYTVLTANVLHANLPEAGVRDYILRCLDYYVRQGKEGYIDTLEERLLALTRVTPELRQQIGDLFYEAGQYERAMAEYTAALRLSPGNREVAKRISEYYVREGDEAMARQDYESAVASFEKALDSDPLHPSAEGKRLTAEKLIAEREARKSAAEAALRAGDDFWRRADQATLENRHIEAISLLGEAEAQYNQVTNEFAPLYKRAELALRDLTYRVRELKDRLVADAQNLSGSGFLAGVADSAAATKSALGDEALRGLTRLELKARTEELRQNLQTAFEIR